MKYFPWSSLVAAVVALLSVVTICPWLGAPRDAASLIGVLIYFNVVHCIEGLGE